MRQHESFTTTVFVKGEAPFVGDLALVIAP